MQANLKEMLVDELRDIYYAEKQLIKALPKLAKAASSPDLRRAFEDHLGETEGQVTRLERAFELLGEPVRGKTCHGIVGIVEEGSELIKQHSRNRGAALDAGLIAGGQRAEHYEMAAYGALRAWAEALGQNEVADLLAATLEEEKAADKKLSQLAEAGINSAATARPNGRAQDADGSQLPARTKNVKKMSGNGHAQQTTRRGLRRAR